MSEKRKAGEISTGQWNVLEKINEEESSTEEIDLKSSRQDIRPLKNKKNQVYVSNPFAQLHMKL